MVHPYLREPEFISRLKDGTVKQLNPFSGTEVWTVAGRGNRPLGVVLPDPVPLDPAQHGRHCAFCEARYLDTPPEKSRVVRNSDGTWETRYRIPAEELEATTAEFRRVPNLFEILSYDYWHDNYGYELPARVRDRKTAYLSSPMGRAHVLAVVRNKLKAGGRSDEIIEALGEEGQLEAASGFFGGGHDVVIARRHFVDGATDNTQLAGSGTLTPEEHHRFTSFTVESVSALFDLNRYARYVAVFQNWLRPAGASFDHLHKQLVAIDEHGPRTDRVLARLHQDPQVFAGVLEHAFANRLVVAQDEHAVAVAGVGYRYPSLEVWSASPDRLPWEHDDDEVGGVSDLLHALHAASGTAVPTNEEWHHRPPGIAEPMPWQIVLKWRVSTLAGFEGGTKINVNTLDPATLRERVVAELHRLRDAGAVAEMRIGDECRPGAQQNA